MIILCKSIEIEKIIIAGCFHDLGIWTNDTIDYLKPSIALAKTHLDNVNKSEWSHEIELMIDMHHKLWRARNCEYPLVEVFRKADWVDVSIGFRTFGLSREYIRTVQAAFPNLGFHKSLVRLAKLQFKRNPLNPLPMLKIFSHRTSRGE